MSRIHIWRFVCDECDWLEHRASTSVIGKESAITAGAFKNAFDGLDNSLRMMQGVLSDPRRLMQEATKGQPLLTH